MMKLMQNRNRDLEHVHALVDGELPEDDAAALRARLGTEPELAAAHDRLVDLNDQLKTLPLPELPAEIYARVMARARLPAPPAPTRWENWRRPAMGFAAGVVAAVLIANFDSGVMIPADPGPMVGSMVQQQTLPAAAPASRVELALPQARGSLTAWRDGDLVLVGIELSEALDLQLEVPLDPATTRVVGYARLDGQAANAHLEPERLLIEQSGSGRFALFLNSSAPAMQIMLRHDGDVLQRATLNLGETP